jgi:hypothetical protein
VLGTEESVMLFADSKRGRSDEMWLGEKRWEKDRGWDNNKEATGIRVVDLFRQKLTSQEIGERH